MHEFTWNAESALHGAKSRRREGERGSILFVSIVVMMVLVGMTMSMLLVVKGGSERATSSQERMRALYAAEFGVEQAILDLSAGGTGTVGTRANPIDIEESCSVWVATTDNGDNTFTIRSTGIVGRTSRSLESTVVEQGHVFHHAVFAGNSGSDPSYVLNFSGKNSDADVINGDIYSGGSVAFKEDATTSGHSRATGSVTGTNDYTTGVTQPIPDIAGMGYETLADVDVAAEFAAAGVWKYDNAGGNAWQLPEANAAHIFRKNPSDRCSENNSTVKDDYYLEDPYETVRRDKKWDGTDAYMISVPGSDDPNKAVELIYFIDGNLWIHNIPTYSFKFKSEGKGVKVTFVARGDIIFSDNVFYDQNDKDGVAFIAVKDPDFPNTGNIYFGDPRGGTIETMYGFMYAENNFYDVNLSSSGSKRVIVHGTMSAGNKVDIQRDHANGSHSQLQVHHDLRLKTGALELPGLPSSQAELSYRITAWRSVTHP